MIVKLKSLVPALFLSCLSVHGQDIQVTAKEIQETWIGKTLTGTTANGAVMQVDGVATLSAGSTFDSGSWRLAENGYCTTWKKIRAGQERCFTAIRSGSKVTVNNPDGTISGYFTDIK